MTQYNVKCNECNKFKLNTKMVNSFGKWVCKKCLLIKNIQEANSVNIPAYLMQKYNWKCGMRIELIPMKEGILISKTKGDDA